jgi:OOP family OmpA-OmpF porin
VRARITLAVAVLTAALLAQPATADPVGGHVQLTPFGGYTIFDGDLRLNGHSLRDDLYFGGRLGYQFNPMWGLELAGGFTPTAEDAPGNPEVDFYHYSGNVTVTPWPGLFGAPFLLAGYGSAQAKPATGADVSEGSIEVGGGIRVWLTDALGLRVEARQIYYSYDQPGGSPKVNNLVGGLGLTLALGAKGRDTDSDGVPDRRDSCANTPHGARVDSRAVRGPAR